MSDCTSDLARLLDSDLLEAGWDPSFIGPRDVASASYQYLLGSIRASLLKKYISYEESREKNPERERKALDLFLQNNEDCRSMETWSPEAASGTDEVLQTALGEMRSVLDDFFHPMQGRSLLFSLGSILSNGDLGPGASVGCRNNDFYTKLFDSSLASTSQELHSYYAAHVASNPVWAIAEKSREAMYGSCLVPGSKLFFAPKTREISRVACTEPPLNMFFQKGQQALLELRLRQVFGLDLRGAGERNISPQQDKNRELARLGSIHGTFGTIDLSSASDRNSNGMVRSMIPRTAFEWLWRTRSPSTRLPSGELLELYMVSSMGNAFTFPLETAIFASAVVAAYRVLDIKVKYPRGNYLGNFAVFGDDIIVVTEAYDLVCKILSALGHKVNYDKSFNSGLFRESCGSDWFAGRNVRGVYLKRLHHDVDFYKAINRLNIWSGKHGVPLARTVRHLYLSCRRKLHVPMHEQDTAGIRTPFSLLGSLCKEPCGEAGAWLYQQTPYPRVKQLGIGGTTFRYLCRTPREDRLDIADGESLLYRQFRWLADRTNILPSISERERARRLRAVEQALRHYGYDGREPGNRRSGRNSRSDRTGRKRIDLTLVEFLVRTGYNAEGVLLSAVASRLRDGCFLMRDFRGRTVVKVRSSSCWDYVGPELQKSGAAEGFHLLCLVNLGEVNQTPIGR